MKLVRIIYKLIKTHFKNKNNKYGKIINSKTIRIRYSHTHNLATIISSMYNKKLDTFNPNRKKNINNSNISIHNSNSITNIIIISNNSNNNNIQAISIHTNFSSVNSLILNNLCEYINKNNSFNNSCTMKGVIY